MAFIDLTFTSPSASTTNSSMQVGDTVYYVDPTTSGGFTTSGDEPTKIGAITAITISATAVVITVECELTLVAPTTTSFIFFSKDGIVNTSSFKGYYGSVKLNNNSLASCELFSVGCEVSESSK